MNINFSTYGFESVTSGHPDKICDQVSDAVLDECLKQDTASRVAIESFGGHGMLVVGGEITSKAKVNFVKLAEDLYREIGYENELKVITNISQQSPNIAQGVDTGGAGDQGIMYGFATDATDDYLPFGVGLVHKLTKGLQELREQHILSWLRPDGKAQLIVQNGKVIKVLVSTQHAIDAGSEQVRADLIDKLIQPVIGDIDQIEVLTNPTGSFSIGGFDSDTGLTGRKIMVDTYGGIMPHGGGCFSGKDPTKVDRSAAYMCRFAAKNIVANGLAHECIVSVAYAIGKAEPLMLEAVNEKGEKIHSNILKKFDFRPRAIIERLNLLTPIYRETASYGHFTRTHFPWEKIIKM